MKHLKKKYTSKFSWATTNSTEITEKLLRKLSEVL